MCLEALSAVHRLVGARLEGNLRLAPALGACGSVHLPRGAVTATTAAGVPPATAVPILIALLLPRGAARLTTLRLAEAALKVEGLLALREHECLPAIAAGERSIAHSA